MSQVTCFFKRGNPPAFDKALVLMGLLREQLAELADLDVPECADCPEWREQHTCDCRGVVIDAQGMLWTLEVWHSILGSICRDFDDRQAVLRERVEAALEPDDDNPDLLPLPVIVTGRGEGA